MDRINWSRGDIAVDSRGQHVRVARALGDRVDVWDLYPRGKRSHFLRTISPAELSWRQS